MMHDVCTTVQLCKVDVKLNLGNDREKHYKQREWSGRMVTVITPG